MATNSSYSWGNATLRSALGFLPVDRVSGAVVRRHGIPQLGDQR
ncbi:hypothetical protein [Streptomyces sp. NPDC058964]